MSRTDAGPYSVPERDPNPPWVYEREERPRLRVEFVGTWADLEELRAEVEEEIRSLEQRRGEAS